MVVGILFYLFFTVMIGRVAANEFYYTHPTLKGRTGLCFVIGLGIGLAWPIVLVIIPCGLIWMAVSKAAKARKSLAYYLFGPPAK